MDDQQIHGSIEKLVAEEHELWQRESDGNATESDRRRLQDVKISLDQCWDLLRQRRALRESGFRARLRLRDREDWRLPHGISGSDSPPAAGFVAPFDELCSGINSQKGSSNS